jgi:hypothetical protein
MYFKSSQQAYIFGLEELCNVEEKLCGFFRIERLPKVQQVNNLGEKQSTFSGVDRRVVEHTRLLQDSSFVKMVKEANFTCIIEIKALARAGTDKSSIA